jgi:hypothetical protein
MPRRGFAAALALSRIEAEPHSIRFDTGQSVRFWGAYAQAFGTDRLAGMKA